MYLQFDDIRNAVYANEKKTAINCEVLFRHLPGEYVPFTATPDDPQAWGRDIFAQCDRGKWEGVAPYVVPFVDYRMLAESERQHLLKTAKDTISIWQTQLLLGSITEANKVSLIEWLSYIEELNVLDFSSVVDNGKPEDAPDIDWPEKPE